MQLPIVLMQLPELLYSCNGYVRIVKRHHNLKTDIYKYSKEKCMVPLILVAALFR
jgi:hypothetical protein